MNNTKTTKRALLSSVMAMFICVAMLIGTTFYNGPHVKTNPEKIIVNQIIPY